MFRKIFWINLGLFVIVVLLSYNLYRFWSQIMEQLSVPSVQVNVDKKPERTIKDEEKEEIPDYRPSSRMSYSPIIEKDLFRPEREEWQPPPPPEEEEIELKQTEPYPPQFPGQAPQPEIKQPTVHGIIIIGETKKYAIMQGWTREDPQERTRKIRLGNGQIREVPLPPIPGKVIQDKIRAYRIGDTISEAQIVDILPDTIVMEKEDGERYDILLREPTRLEMWKPSSEGEQVAQYPGQAPGGEPQQAPGQMPVMPGAQPYPVPQGVPVYPYVPVYPPPIPPGYIPPGFVPPQGGGVVPPPSQRLQPPVPPQQPVPRNLPVPQGFPQGRFPYPPGQPFPRQIQR